VFSFAIYFYHISFPGFQRFLFFLSVKCGGLLSSSSEVCFEAVLSEIVVEIGAVGTSDEVLLEIWSLSLLPINFFRETVTPLPGLPDG
jgi:hypothetical protein